MPCHVPTCQRAVETVQLVSSQEKTGFLEMLLYPSDPITVYRKASVFSGLFRRRRQW